MARTSKPSPVIKVELEDRGQDFTTWYIRDRIVIDCTPFQARVWCGCRLNRTPKVGHKIRFLSRISGEFRELKYPVVSVTVLNEEQSEEIWQQWLKLRKEIITE